MPVNNNKSSIVLIDDKADRAKLFKFFEQLYPKKFEYVFIHAGEPEDSVKFQIWDKVGEARINYTYRPTNKKEGVVRYLKDYSSALFFYDLNLGEQIQANDQLALSSCITEALVNEASERDRKNMIFVHSSGINSTEFVIRIKEIYPKCFIESTSRALSSNDEAIRGVVKKSYESWKCIFFYTFDNLISDLQLKSEDDCHNPQLCCFNYVEKYLWFEENKFINFLFKKDNRNKIPILCSEVLTRQLVQSWSRTLGLKTSSSIHLLTVFFIAWGVYKRVNFEEHVCDSNFKDALITYFNGFEKVAKDMFTEQHIEYQNIQNTYPVIMQQFKDNDRWYAINSRQDTDQIIKTIRQLHELFNNIFYDKEKLPQGQQNGLEAISVNYHSLKRVTFNRDGLFFTIKCDDMMALQKALSAIINGIIDSLGKPGNSITIVAPAGHTVSKVMIEFLLKAYVSLKEIESDDPCPVIFGARHNFIIRKAINRDYSDCIEIGFGWI